MTAERMQKNRFIVLFMVLVLVCTALVSGCNAVSSDSAGIGTGGTGSFTLASLDVTDTPASDYAHVYVTVTGVAFHTDATATFSGYSSGKKAGWQAVRLAAPKTIDLAQLRNGIMYADLNGNSSLFSGITLPVGRYQQIRIFLASTEDAFVGSVSGLVFNNEVQRDGDSGHYPLRIPAAAEGIKVVPESPVDVTSGSAVSLALDFNINSDVVAVKPNGSPEYILKPRLGFFDMERVGAIKGTIGFANLSTSRIEIKAEQVKSGTAYRTVRRVTAVDKTTGKFNLYPLPVFGNASTAVYDILIRGRNVQTTIIKGITVHKGTTVADGVDIGTIALLPGTQFKAQLDAGIHPSGAWLNFYQTIAGDPVSYEVSYQHLDPYTGKFGMPVELANGPIRVATYTPGSILAFTADNFNQGKYSMIADITGLYERGAALAGIHGAVGQEVSLNMTQENYPQVNAKATAGKIFSVFDMTLLGTGMGAGMGGGDRTIGNPTIGQLFITHGGMIIDSINTVAAALHTGGSFELNNLPSNIEEAYYSLYALGWGNGTLAAGSTLGIDLRNGNSIITVIMK